MNRYRIIALIYAVLLFGGLLGSLFLTGHFAGDYTAAEGTPGARTETALRQNLPLRDALKRWKTTLLMLGGVQELDGIYFTGEGLIENLTVTDEALGEKNLAALQDYCREAEPYTVLLPSACAISSQLLPEAALLFDQETWLQNAAAALSPLCREVLNAYPLLEENGDSRLFYRTDSRPTQLTGYLLYQALGQALDYFPYAKDSFSNTPLRYDCTGDLYARWSYDKVRADVVTALLPLEDSRSYTITHTAADGTVTRWNTLYPLEGTAGIDCILGGPAAIIAVTAEGSIPRSLLILGDENALCVIPYLALHYDRITYVDVTRCSEEQLAAIAGTEYSRTLLLYGAPTLLNTALTTGLTTLTQSRMPGICSPRTLRMRGFLFCAGTRPGRPARRQSRLAGGAVLPPLRLPACGGGAGRQNRPYSRTNVSRETFCRVKKKPGACKSSGELVVICGTWHRH